MSQNLLQKILDTQGDKNKNLTLSDIKLFRNTQTALSGKVTPGNEPIHPGGGALRIAPFIILITAVFIFYGIYQFVTTSDPYRISESFIRSSPELEASIGRVIECDPWFPFNISMSGNDARVRLTFSVKGESASAKVYIVLHRKRGEWKMASAHYREKSGMVKQLKIINIPVL